MIEVNEYYVYKSEPSKHPVKFICNGAQVVYSEKAEATIYNKPASIFQRTDNNEHRVINSLKKIRDNCYVSEGALLPAQYLGLGTSTLEDPTGKKLSTKTGHLFMLYTVPIVLTETEVANLIHPKSAVADL